MKNSILLVALLWSISMHADNIKKGLKYLEKKNYAKAHTCFNKAVVKDSNNAIGWYGLYKLYSDKATPYYNLEKGNTYAFNAKNTLLKIDYDPVKYKLTRSEIENAFYSIDRELYNNAYVNISIISLEYYISISKYTPNMAYATKSRDSLAYAKASTENTISAYAIFVQLYPEANELKQAQENIRILEFSGCKTSRDISCLEAMRTKYSDNTKWVVKIQNEIYSMALDLAVESGKSSEVKAYLSKYTESNIIAIAQAKYDSMFFSESIPTGDYQKAEEYIRNYPTSKYRKLAEEKLYMFFTADETNTEKLYEFSKKYPENPFAEISFRKHFLLLTNNLQDSSGLAKYVSEYKESKLYNEALEAFYKIYTEHETNPSCILSFKQFVTEPSHIDYLNYKYFITLTKEGLNLEGLKKFIANKKNSGSIYRDYALLRYYQLFTEAYMNKKNVAAYLNDNVYSVSIYKKHAQACKFENDIYSMSETNLWAWITTNSNDIYLKDALHKYCQKNTQGKEAYKEKLKVFLMNKTESYIYWDYVTSCVRTNNNYGNNVQCYAPNNSQLEVDKNIGELTYAAVEYPFDKSFKETKNKAAEQGTTEIVTANHTETADQIIETTTEESQIKLETNENIIFKPTELVAMTKDILFSAAYKLFSKRIDYNDDELYTELLRQYDNESYNTLYQSSANSQLYVTRGKSILEDLQKIDPFNKLYSFEITCNAKNYWGGSSAVVELENNIIKITSIVIEHGYTMQNYTHNSIKFDKGKWLNTHFNALNASDFQFPVYNENQTLNEYSVKPIFSILPFKLGPDQNQFIVFIHRMEVYWGKTLVNTLSSTHPLSHYMPDYNFR